MKKTLNYAERLWSTYYSQGLGESGKPNGANQIKNLLDVARKMDREFTNLRN